MQKSRRQGLVKEQEVPIVGRDQPRDAKLVIELRSRTILAEALFQGPDQLHGLIALEVASTL